MVNKHQTEHTENQSQKFIKFNLKYWETRFLDMISSGWMILPLILGGVMILVSVSPGMEKTIIHICNEPEVENTPDCLDYADKYLDRYFSIGVIIFIIAMIPVLINIIIKKEEPIVESKTAI